MLDDTRVARPESAESMTAYACPGQNGRELSFKGCRSISSSPVNNRRHCAQKNCQCPWRLCWLCVHQGVSTDAAVVVDFESGLCNFHAEHGVDYARPRLTAVTRAGAGSKPYTERQGEAAVLRSAPPPRALPERTTRDVKWEPSSLAAKPADAAVERPPLTSVQHVSKLLSAPQPEPETTGKAPLVVHKENQPAETLTTQISSPNIDGEEIIGKLIRVPCDTVCRFTGQPRTYFDQDELKALAKSIKKRQIVPALLCEYSDPAHPKVRYRIIDGERRWRACQMVGKKLVGVIYDGLSEEAARLAYEVEYYETSVAANFIRSNHTPIETAEAAKKLHDNGRTWEEVSLTINLSVQAIERHLKLLKLAPGVKKLVRSHGGEGGLGIGHALRLLEYPPTFQELVAPEIVNQNLDFNQAAHHIRRRAIELGVVKANEVRDRRSLSAERIQHMPRDLGQIDRRLDTLLNWPGVSFGGLYAHRSVEDKQEILEVLGRIEEKVTRMRALVASAQPAQEAAE